MLILFHYKPLLSSSTMKSQSSWWGTKQAMLSPVSSPSLQPKPSTWYCMAGWNDPFQKHRSSWLSSPSQTLSPCARVTEQGSLSQATQWSVRLSLSMDLLGHSSQWSPTAGHSMLSSCFWVCWVCSHDGCTWIAQKISSSAAHSSGASVWGQLSGAGCSCRGSPRSSWG